MDITDTYSKAPYLAGDSTRDWVEQNRDTNGLISPQLVLRFATDSHWIHNMQKVLPAYGRSTETKALMNCGLPGQNIFGALNWQVDESHENEEASASFEMVNALPVSIVNTTLSAPLKGELYGSTIVTTYVSDSIGVLESYNGNTAAAFHNDSQGYQFRDDNIRYRQFDYQTLSLTDASSFPNGAVPDDADNDIADDNFYSYSSAGVGAYFVLVGTEIIKVTKKASGVLYIPPGGRAQNGILYDHPTGEKVTLLGFGPHTGEYVGHGMFAVDDYKPYMAMFRTGSCITSYEGYGKFNGPLTHQFNYQRNYTFTGYWFVKSTEDSIDDTGVPRLKVTLSGPQDLVNRQKITLDTIQRIKTNYGQWMISKDGVSMGRPLFSAGGQTRDIPGDWVDYNSWDPTQMNAYPLKIKTEIAQHKAYFDHMADTALGSQCQICLSELKEWQQRTGHKPTEAQYADAAGRAVGRHIYKESIRVQHPIQTYLRLMLTLCAMAWDHPPQGLELAQRFTKIPNSLYNNMRNIGTGLVYNGQLDFVLDSGANTYDWAHPSYESSQIDTIRKNVDCPFESQYDNVEFAQPIRDLADTNNAHFWINRRGYPVFLPKEFRLRPSGTGYQDLDQGTKYPMEGPDGQTVGGSWNLQYGSSITSYTHAVSSDSVVTQCWITATTGFDSNFTVSSAGTGFNASGKKILFGPLSGSRDGLVLTGGVQQPDSTSMDNIILGLEWDLKPDSLGIKVKTPDGDTQYVDAKPPLYDGQPPMGMNSAHSSQKATAAIQTTINWFLERHYFPAIQDDRDKNTKWWISIPVTGDFGFLTKAGVTKIQHLVGVTEDGTWDRNLYTHLVDWFNDNSHYLHFDIYWYVQNGREWEEYVAALTGISVPLKKIESKEPKGTLKGAGYANLPNFTIDDNAFKRAINSWQSRYIQQATNVGNRIVDDSINKSSTRSISSNIADPRIQPGDVIWANVPGHITDTNLQGGRTPPFSNGIYVSSVSRQMDLTSGTYQATYTGYKYISNLGADRGGIYAGYDFITNPSDALLNAKG